MKSAAEAVEKARKKLAEDKAKLEALEEAAALDEQIVAMSGDGATIEQIAASSGRSRDQVRRVLAAAGRLTSRRRKADAETTRSITSDLKNGLGVPETVEKHNMAEAVVRRIAQENGVVAPRSVKPRRSPEELERIRALDAAVKAEFGAGLSALGEVLRKANKSFSEAVDALPSQTSVGEDSVYPDTTPVEPPREHHGDGDEPMPVADEPPLQTGVVGGPPRVPNPAADDDLPW